MNVPKKYKKLFITIITLILIFCIYTVNADKRISYIALGDSLATGQNPYGGQGYGYTDYIANYLKKNDALRSYINDFAKSGYRTKDLIQDINGGKTIQKEKTSINIKRALRESNLVTISIGANDFLEKLNFSIYNVNIPTTENLKLVVDTIIPKIDETLAVIRKHAKGRVILIGYYNPVTNEYASNSKEIDEIFAYIKDEYQKVCDRYNVEYIDVYQAIKKDRMFIPNPFDIHPSVKGYEAIAKEIINHLEKTS